MRVNPSSYVNKGIPAFARRKWFIWYDGIGDEAPAIMLSLNALLEDNGDVDDLCEWARVAKNGDVYLLGGAAPPGRIVCDDEGI